MVNNDLTPLAAVTGQALALGRGCGPGTNPDLPPGYGLTP
jgi:hypothetical protein